MAVFWGTPIWDLLIKDQASIDSFLELAYKAKAIGKENNRSNAGNAWHSETNFAGPTQKLPIAKEVMDNFKACAWDYGYKLAGPAKLSYWTIISTKYGYNKRHNHPGSLLSAVVYLQVPEKSGRIIFTDPRPCRIMETGFNRTQESKLASITFEPKVGLMLVFPSWLEHEVEMTLSDEDRVIASFNLTPLESP